MIKIMFLKYRFQQTVALKIHLEEGDRSGAFLQMCKRQLLEIRTSSSIMISAYILIDSVCRTGEKGIFVSPFIEQCLTGRLRMETHRSAASKIRNNNNEKKKVNKKSFNCISNQRRKKDTYGESIVVF